MTGWSVRVVSTPWGYVGLAASARGVEEVTLPCASQEGALRELGAPARGAAREARPDLGFGLAREPVSASAGGPGEAEECLARVAAWLEAYSRYPRAAGPGPLEALAWGKVSGFRERVYRVLAEIHLGETLTYGQVAARAGSPKAARAVGRACATNPWPLLIPCHRVVARTNLGGYGGGRALKEALLLWERQNR